MLPIRFLNVSFGFSAQKAQCPLIREDALNHIKDPSMDFMGS